MDINRDFSNVDSEYEYVSETLDGVSSNLDYIDSIISKNLVNWRLQRLTFIDRAIIRCAVYEMEFLNTPSEIVINEALNITRKYSDEGDNKMVGFVNKVLDNIKKAQKK
jgi:N utilization substance protein B